jgi:hypothetical protein
MKTMPPLSLVLALLVASCSCAATAPQEPPPTSQPASGIFAAVGDDLVQVCELKELGAGQTPEDLTSDSLVALPDTVAEFVVHLSEEARAFGIEHRTLELVSVTAGETGPKVRIVATRVESSSADPTVLRVRPTQPLKPGAHQFMAETATANPGETTLHFLGCGFRVPEE